MRTLQLPQRGSSYHRGVELGCCGSQQYCLDPSPYSGHEAVESSSCDQGKLCINSNIVWHASISAHRSQPRKLHSNSNSSEGQPRQASKARRAAETRFAIDALAQLYHILGESVRHIAPCRVLADVEPARCAIADAVLLLHCVAAQPTDVMCFQTSWVKWPVDSERSGFP